MRQTQQQQQQETQRLLTEQQLLLAKQQRRLDEQQLQQQWQQQRQQQQQQPSQLRRTNRWLVLVCSPKMGPLAHALKEAREIQSLCQPCTVLESCTAEALMKELADVTRTPVKGLVFIGHADASLLSQPTLGFTNDQGGLDTVLPETLAKMLSGYAPPNGCLECVFLNGCRSASLGLAVHHGNGYGSSVNPEVRTHRGVPYVLCWETAVDDKAARIFCRKFFEARRDGLSYSQAFSSAEIAVETVTRKGKLSTGQDSKIPQWVLADPEDLSWVVPGERVQVYIPTAPTKSKWISGTVEEENAAASGVAAAGAGAAAAAGAAAGGVRVWKVHLDQSKVEHKGKTYEMGKVVKAIAAMMRREGAPMGAGKPALYTSPTLTRVPFMGAGPSAGLGMGMPSLSRASTDPPSSAPTSSTNSNASTASLNSNASAASTGQFGPVDIVDVIPSLQRLHSAGNDSASQLHQELITSLSFALGVGGGGSEQPSPLVSVDVGTGRDSSNSSSSGGVAGGRQTLKSGSGGDDEDRSSTAGKSSGLDLEEVDEKLKIAKEFLKQQRYEKAREYVIEVLKVQPENQLASMVLTYSLFGCGRRSVQQGKFEEATAHFDEMLRDYPRQVPKERVERALTYKAMLRYALAKKQIGRSNWGSAKESLQLAIESQRLPAELQLKAKGYMRGCAKQRRLLKKKVKLEGRTMQVADEEETSEGFGLYVKAKRHLNHGDYELALSCFEAALDCADLSEEREARAEEYIERLEDGETLASDECTWTLEVEKTNSIVNNVTQTVHTLHDASPTPTADLFSSQMATVAVNDKAPIPGGSELSEPVAMSLEEPLPSNAGDRVQVVSQLRLELSMALSVPIGRINILDTAEGSSVVTIAFKESAQTSGGGGADTKAAARIEKANEGGAAAEGRQGDAGTGGEQGDAGTGGEQGEAGTGGEQGAAGTGGEQGEAGARTSPVNENRPASIDGGRRDSDEVGATVSSDSLVQRYQKQLQDPESKVCAIHSLNRERSLRLTTSMVAQHEMLQVQHGGVERGDGIERKDQKLKMEKRRDHCIGSQITLWRGSKSDSASTVTCKIESLLGKGTSGTVYKVIAHSHSS
jgi:tetratricopeptide (TPR) repeat protein